MDDAQDVPHGGCYSIGYTELYRCYLTWLVADCLTLSPVVRFRFVTSAESRVASHSHYITHLYTYLIMVATRLLSRNIARQSIAFRKPVSISIYYDIWGIRCKYKKEQIN